MKSDTDPTYGFVWGIRTLGFLDLALLTLSIILVKERLPHIIENSKDGESRWRYILRVYILQCFDAKAFLDMKYLFVSWERYLVSYPLIQLLLIMDHTPPAMEFLLMTPTP